MIKVLSDIDVTPILECYRQLEDSISWTDYGHKGKQSGVQYKTGEDPWTSAVGKSRGNDLEIIELNPAFKNTPIEELVTRLKLTRTRLMWVGPFACYSMHKDPSRRIHIPLITNSDCYFLFKYGTPTHLRLGKIYLTDTRSEHTFINCSDSPRLHLVGAV
jgi:hypothetical protein